MLSRDLACAVLGAALAAAFWIGASRLPRSLLSDEFGADGLPRGLALLLAAVSLLIGVRALLQARKARGQAPAFEAAKAGSDPMREHAKALGVAALGFAYVLAAPWLGYAPAATLLIFATAWYYGAKPGAMLAGISVAGAIALWLLFAKLLGASMPTGVWPRLLG